MGNYKQISKEDVEYNLVELKHLVFEVTDECNLRCKYCGYAGLYEGYDKRESLFFPFQRAKLLIDYLYHNYWKQKVGKGFTRTINIGFYGGEPLLNVPFIKEVISYVEQLPYIGITFTFSMTTNAMLLHRYMDYLVEKDFSMLISLDGDEMGQSYRVDAVGNNSYQRVIKNIYLLRDSYPTFFERNVSFNSVLHNRNSVETTYNFINESFKKTPRISALSKTNVRKDKVEEFNLMYKNAAQDLYNSSKCEMIEKSMFVNGPRTALLLDYIRDKGENMYQSYVSLLLDREKIKFPPTATCTPFLRKMFITVKGKILQCEKISHDFALGEVTDNDVSLNLEQIANQHNKYTSTYLKDCKTCAVRSNCKRCVYTNITPLESRKCYAYTTDSQVKSWEKESLSYLERHPELYEDLLTKVIIRD